jgi:hypothetical protein
MYLRRTAQMVAANLAHTIISTGASIESVAQAADTTTAEMSNRVNPDLALDYPFADLAVVGGFLHVSPSDFYEGVNE